MRHSNKDKRNQGAICTAAWLTAAALAGTASAQSEFVVSTSGATAIGAFTRMNSNATSPTSGTIVRGPLALGIDGLVIGNTTYNLTPGISYMGIADPTAPVSGEPGLGLDRVVYDYRESGSIQGILDLVDSNGLRTSNPGVPIAPGDPAANLFLWVNGSRFASVSSGYQDPGPNTLPNLINGTPNTGRTNGRNYTSGVNPVPEINQNGQPYIQVAWSDVKFEQAFAVSGVSTFTSSPTVAGYGLGRGNIGGTNFQSLRNAAAITGGTDPSTTHLRNQSIAMVPFNIVANPGTGLAELSKEQALWMQLVGRLSNGANFNSVTREIGSGTRNEGLLNLGGDPSWGGGERDRRATAEFDTFDVEGNPIHVNIGDEVPANLSLTGSTIQDLNENRIGPTVRYSDKVSGSSGTRATVAVSRMSMGILSGGDSTSAGSGSALDAHKTTTSNPLRALRIDWDNDGSLTGLQATAANVINGSYRMWGSEQAITVAPYANPTANDVGANAYKPIANDLNDQAPGDPTTSAQVGIARKFLNNITQPLSTYDASGTFTSITPADFILTAGFIPPQIMGVTKQYDGGAQTPRVRSSQEEALYQAAVVDSNGALNTATNWADPGTMNGGLLIDAVKYRIFASANNSQAAVANRTINVTTRTNLAGDFNGDTVRDIGDVQAMALAYANSATYLTTPTSGEAHGWNYNGTAVNSTSSGTNASTADGLIVLSDFNSNGNVKVDMNNGSFATTTVERSDVRYFLLGAAVDTSAYDTGVDAAAKAKNRRENGVRFGTLKKNAGIGSFNSALDSFVGVVTNPNTSLAYTQNEVDTLKINKFDVNGDDAVTRADAKIVDRNVGKNYTNLPDVLSTYDDLVAAEFQDNQTITHVTSGAGSDGTGTSDFKLIRDYLGSTSLLDGDANMDGVVNLYDLVALAVNWQQPVDQWSDADFDFNGIVNSNDLGLLATHWQGSAASLGSALEGLGLPVSAVPEPSSLALLAMAPIFIRRRRRA